MNETRDRPADQDEIVVTPEMAFAGAEELLKFSREEDDEEISAAEIYRTMERIRHRIKNSESGV
jgi:hypothetical protein